MKTQFIMDSKIGKLHLVASDKGLQGIFFDRQPYPVLKKLNSKVKAEKIMAQAVEQIEKYFAGKTRKFTVPLDLQGTPFQKKVWKELLKIPYGKTASYKDIAKRISNPKAMRAVGSANGKNPVCVIVPCHRVIAADGSIGGYSGGLDKKKILLGLECV